MCLPVFFIPYYGGKMKFLSKIPIIFLLLMTAACNENDNIPEEESQNILIKGQECKLLINKDNILKKYKSMKKVDSVNTDNLYAKITILAEGKSVFLTKKPEEKEDRFSIEFSVPQDAEYAKIDILREGDFFGASQYYPVMKQDSSYTHRTYMFGMHFSRSKKAYMAFYTVDKDAYPYRVERELNYLERKHHSDSKVFLSKVDSLYDVFERDFNKQEDLRTILNLSSFANTYTKFKHYSKIEKTLNLIESKLQQFDSQEIESIEEAEISNSIRFLSSVSSRIPDTINASKYNPIDRLSQLLDIYELSGNRHILYTLLLKSRIGEFLSRDSNLADRYLHLLHERIIDDIKDGYHWEFRRNQAIFDESAELFNRFEKYDKSIDIIKAGLPVLAKTDRFIVSQNTDDYTSMFNGNDAFYSNILYELAYTYYQSGDFLSAKNILLENRHIAGWNPGTFAGKFCPLLFELYKDEGKIDSADMCLSWADELGYKKAKYLYKDFLKHKKNMGLGARTFKEIKESYPFNESDFTQVPDVSLNTSRGPYRLRNNSVEYKFIFKLSDMCNSCNMQFDKILKDIEKNFLPESYHILVVSSKYSEYVKNSSKNQPDSRNEFFYLPDNDSVRKKIGLNKKLQTETVLIQKGKLMKFESLNMPDYFLKTKVIL